MLLKTDLDNLKRIEERSNSQRRERKRLSRSLAVDFKKISQKLTSLDESEILKRRSDKMAICGDFCCFATDDKGQKHLIHSGDCRLRMCPCCEHVRGTRYAQELYGVMCKFLDKGYEPVTMTLSIVNTNSAGLSVGIGVMQRAFRRLTSKKCFASRFNKAFSGGTVRFLEVTYNRGDNSYHPHFHVVAFVKRGYCDKWQEYLSQQDLTKLWQKALGVKYKPYVWIARLKNYENGQYTKESLLQACMEFSKYCTKYSSFIDLPDNQRHKVILTLSRALKGRRLMLYSGYAKEVVVGVREELKKLRKTSFKAKVIVAFVVAQIFKVCREQFSQGFPPRDDLLKWLNYCRDCIADYYENQAWGYFADYKKACEGSYFGLLSFAELRQKYIFNKGEVTRFDNLDFELFDATLLKVRVANWRFSHDLEKYEEEEKEGVIHLAMEKYIVPLQGKVFKTFSEWQAENYSEVV